MGVLLTALIIVCFRADRDPLAQIESKSKRIARIKTIRLALSATSEEQNCAVLATSQQDSKVFVYQARMEAAALERGRLELVELIQRWNCRRPSPASRRRDLRVRLRGMICRGKKFLT